MKQLIRVTIVVLFAVLPAQSDDMKLVGRWRAEYALTANDKPHVAWKLVLQKGGTFRMTELAPNAQEKRDKNLEKLETGRWSIIEPSLTEKLKSVIQKTETRVRLQFALGAF